MNLDGYQLPDTISTEQVKAFLACLGLDNLDQVREVKVGMRAVTVSVMATWPNGAVMLDYDRSRVFEHRLVIPVINPPVETPDEDGAPAPVRADG